MNFKSVKNTSEMQLAGVAIDAEWRDKTLASVTLTDANGKTLRLAMDSYALRAFVPAPPDVEKKYVVSGVVPVLAAPVRETFDTSFEATERKHELERAGVIENAAVAIEDIEIPF